jgi:hypothetical protein
VSYAIKFSVKRVIVVSRRAASCRGQDVRRSPYRVEGRRRAARSKERPVAVRQLPHSQDGRRESEADC